MKPLDLTAPCPKCGYADVACMFHESKWGTFSCIFDVPHMHRTCRRCWFDWPEAPLDQPASGDAKP